MKKESCKSVVVWIVGIILSLGVVASIIFAVVFSSQAKGEVKRLEDTIAQMSQQQGQVVQQPDLTIDFLQSEMQRHREFIENQEDRLIWLVATIGGVGILLIAFVGLANRREIKETIRENYMSVIESEINNMIDGEDNKTYLQNAVSQERMAKSKKILFLYWDDQEMAASDSRKTLQFVESELEEADFKTDSKTFNKNFNQQDFERLIRKSDIIIYEVNQTIEKTSVKDGSAKDDSTKDVCVGVDSNKNVSTGDRSSKDASVKNDTAKNEVFKHFCAACENSKKYGILYIEGTLPEFRSIKKIYTSVVNMRLTLKQMIYSILYH